MRHAWWCASCSALTRRRSTRPRVPVAFSQSDADRLLAEFQVADLNDDGGISFPEFVRYYAVMREMGPGAGLSSDEIAWLRSLFDRFDGDKDGELEFAELADLLRQCFPSRAKDARRLMGEIRKADLNKVSRGARTHRPRTRTRRPRTRRPRTLRPRTHRPRTRRPRTHRPRTHRPRTHRPRTHRPDEEARRSASYRAAQHPTALHRAPAHVQDGRVSFHEFLRFYEMLVASGANMSEIARMFYYFDVDGSGELERAEFLSLLHQIFPERCEENEQVRVPCGGRASGGSPWSRLPRALPAGGRLPTTECFGWSDGPVVPCTCPRCD